MKVTVEIELTDEQAEALRTMPDDWTTGVEDRSMFQFKRLGVIDGCCWGDWHLTDLGRQVRAKLREEA